VPTESDGADGPLLSQKSFGQSARIPEDNLIHLAVGRRHLSGQGGAEAHADNTDFVYAGVPSPNLTARRNRGQPCLDTVGVVVATRRVARTVVIEPQGTQAICRQPFSQQPQGVVAVQVVEPDRWANDGAATGEAILRAVEPPKAGRRSSPNQTGRAFRHAVGAARELRPCHLLRAPGTPATTWCSRTWAHSDVFASEDRTGSDRFAYRVVTRPESPAGIVNEQMPRANTDRDPTLRHRRQFGLARHGVVQNRRSRHVVNPWFSSSASTWL